MNSLLTRRRFLERSALLGAGLVTAGVLPRLRAGESAANRVRIGVMGLGHGKFHLEGFPDVPGVEIAYVCDVDQRRVDAGLALVKKKQSGPVRGISDFRRILDDPTIDAIAIAAPNFWHTPAAMMACAAGKHVYVEKPGSHNAHEAGLIVAAARKHRRIVQMGNQRRSAPYIIEAIQQVQQGAIGTVRFARCASSNHRGTIGNGRPGPVPEWLNYDLWQGPVPDRPYRDNLVHYNWHWMWHWGGGELANTGPHFLDLARWGLGVDSPRRITCNGARYHYADDQETPDQGLVTFDFGDKGASYDWCSANRRVAEALPIVRFYGDKGSLALEKDGYKIHDLDGHELAKVTDQKVTDLPHYTNFIEAIRGRARLNSEIAEGQKSAMLCHLGNIAQRSGGAIDFDPKTQRIVGHPEAEKKYWSREYRPGWEPKL